MSNDPCSKNCDDHVILDTQPVPHKIENGADSIVTKFTVAGMDCADEVSAIQKVLAHAQIYSVRANLMSATIEVLHSPSLTRELLKKKIESAGVKVVASAEAGLFGIGTRRLVLVASSGIALAIGFVWDNFLEGDSSTTLFFYSTSTLIAGTLIFPKALRSIRQIILDMNVLMVVAVIGAFAIKEYSEAATVVFLFSLAELLESFSIAKARSAIREVLSLTPPKAFLLQIDGSTAEVPVEQVKIGETIRIKAGERIPVDGEVVNGSSLVNQAPLTGESTLIEKKVGSEIFAGTINETGVLDVRSSRAFEDSKVSQIIQLVEEAQKSKAPSEKFVDSFARIYTPVVFIIAILTVIIPPLFFGGEWHEWSYRALVLLVIACPCALVISTPVSIVSGLASMAKNGVLVKGGVFLEAIGKICALAVDKTGTITEGRPRVKKVIPWNGFPELRLLELAASIESLSSHPLAQAVVDYAKNLNVPLKKVSDFETVVGKGAVAKIETHEYFLGNHRYVHELGVCTPALENELTRLEEQAHSVIIVGHRPHGGCVGEVLGIFALGDTIRENARGAIAQLHKAGVEKIVMLSGDNQRTASAIAKEAGIDEAIGDLMPDDKVRHIKALVEKYGSVAMIGDGINDAPALAQASVGIAMGGVGTDTAIETSDVTLMQDDLEQVSNAIRMGKRALSIIRFNIGFALATKAIFLVLAVFGISNLWLAVAADMGASLFVTFNALRLLRSRKGLEASM